MEANTGRMELKAGQEVGPYQHSFGALKDGTCYMNGWEGKDMRPQLKATMDRGFKALTSESGGAGTAGYALVPIYVDPRIVDRSRKYTPLVEMIPRVTNRGLTADYNVITAKGGAVVAAEDAALSETNDTYDRQSTSIKFLYAVGRVTGPAQAAVPSYMLEGFEPSGAGNVAGNPFAPQSAPNAMQLEVLMKARALKELEENLIVNGDTDDDTNEYNGIVDIMGTTNQSDLSSAALTWDDIEDSVQDAFDDGGRPNLAVCSSSVLVDIRKLMIDTFRYGPRDMASGADLPFGVSPKLVIQTMVGPIPVIPSMYLSNTSGAKQIFFLDTDVWEMRVLQDMTYEELAHTNDSRKFMLKIYECLICKAPQFNSFIDNIG